MPLCATSIAHHNIKRLHWFSDPVYREIHQGLQIAVCDDDDEEEEEDDDDDDMTISL